MSDLPSNPQPGDEEFDPADMELDEGDGPEPEAEDQELDEGNEPEPEADDGEAEPGPRQTRSGGRRDQNQRLRESNQRLERELQELRGRVDGFARPQPAAPDPAAQARAEQEKWERRALMSPVELVQDVQREATQQFQQALLLQQVQVQDQIDRQAYEATAATSRVHRQYQSRVEQVLAAERARGNIAANRTAILKYLIGEDAITRGNNAAPGQRRAAQRRVASQTGRPTNARGDAARGGGTRNQDASDEALLRGITAADI